MKILTNRESRVPNPDSKRRKRLRFQGAFFVCALVASVIVTSGAQVGALPAPPNTFVSASVVDGVPTPDSPLSDSDCALVIQMTGTIASGLGVYEILEPATATPERTYSASEAVQFVVLPGGCDQVIDVDTAYTPPAWNPETGTGGVVFLGGTTLNLNANIDASAAGFASGHNIGSGCDGGDGDQSGSQWEGGAGGGGIIGGGGGAGGHVGDPGTFQFDHEFDASPAGGGTATAAGPGGANGDTAGVAPSGGNADCVGSGGSPNQTTVSGAFYSVGAGGGGGGSYGAGGGACSSSSSGAYSAGGGGGGSYTGGGAGGWGGTNTGFATPEEPGAPGNAPIGAAITSASHYLNDEDARLIMGGAGGGSFQGDGSGPAPGGRGGGIVILSFDEVVGGGGSVLSNGGDGSTPTNFGSDGAHGSSGSGGGAGGQIAVYAAAVSSADFAATGGIGGLPFESTASNTGLRHTGGGGASGGGGAVWFAGVGADTSNSGPNAGATSGTSTLAAAGLSDVDWLVGGGNPALGTFPADVSVGGQTFSADAWAAIVGAANLDSQATFKPIAVSLVDASAGAFTLDQLVERFPYFAQPDNPKNLGLGCGPGLGGDGLALTSAEIPLSTLTTGSPAVETFSLGNQVWIDADRDSAITEGEALVPGVEVQLFEASESLVLSAKSAVAATVTNEEGLYLFDKLAAGDYVVAVAPASLAEKGPLAGLVSSAGAVAPDEDVDADDSGSLDAESGYVVAAAVTLGDTEPLAEVPSNDSVTPDANSNLTVDFGFHEPEATIEPAEPAEPVVPVEPAEPGEPVVPVEPVETFSIGNQVWMDANNDGVLDVDEMLVAGVEVHLFAASSDGTIDPTVILATAVTNEEGFYLFDELPAGDYVVGVAPAAFAADGPLVDKIPSTPTVADANTDVDADNNGVVDTALGYVLSGSVTLGDGEPTAEVPSNDSVTGDEFSNLTVDFGFYLPVLNVGVELAVAEEDADIPTAIGDLVTLEVTVTNEGNVAADSIELQVALSEDFESVDPEWTIEGDNLASVDLPGTVAPGETATMEITARVLGAQLDAVPEITEVRAIDDNGMPIVGVLGVSLTNTSVPPTALTLTLGEIPASSAPAAAADFGTPPTLALTGVESSDLALIALLLLTTGAGLVVLGGGRPRLARARREP